MTPEEAAAQLAAAQAALAAAQAAMPAPPDEEDENDPSLLDPNSNDPAYLKEGLRKVHSESKQRRLKIAEQKKLIAEKDIRLADLERIVNETEKAKLEKDGNLQALLEMEKAEKLALVVTLQNSAIEARLEAKIAGAGLPAKFIKMIDQDGIGVDPKTGRVTGVDEAFDAFKRENPDIFTAYKPAAAAAAPTAGTTPAAPAGKPNPADGMIGVMDMSKVRNLANGGKDPAAASAAPTAKPVNVRNLPKKEAQDAYAKFKGAL
jgi:hypothetical protein